MGRRRLEGGTPANLADAHDARRDADVALGEPKTEGPRRVVSLDTATVAALRRYRATQAQERLAFGPDWSETGLVFAAPDGRWMWGWAAGSARRGSAPPTLGCRIGVGVVTSAGPGAELSGFPPGVVEQLGFYVYRLVEPRSGNTFYVGKGRGNRVFEHARGNMSAAQFDDEQLAPKLALIHAIHLAGLSPSHVAHRHGLDEATAFEVEAALMDAYPGLTNIQGGHGSTERGPMHVKEIVDMYERQTADFGDEPVLVIKIRKSLDEGKPLYDAVRVAWKLSPAKAEMAAWVVAASQGVILDVFEPQQWLPATDPEFKG